MTFNKTQKSKADRGIGLNFPCRFPIKVIGQAHPDLIQNIASILQRFDLGFEPAHIVIRPSRGGRYHGLTCTVYARSRTHLDQIYQALTAHPLVSVVL